MGRIVLTVLLCLVGGAPVSAQQKPASVLCTRDFALDTTKQQILVTKSFDDVVQRITILLRAADVLWPHEDKKALAAFMEAFDLAVQNYKEKGDTPTQTSQTRYAPVIALLDQRFKVLSAFAKRDPVRASKLSEQMLQENTSELTGKPAADDPTRRLNGEKLLSVATALVSTDTTAALSFARQSFKYPATLYLAMFLYEMARKDKALADRFYLDGLVAYAKSPMDQFLYLSAYPFGNTRDAGEMPGYTQYHLPNGYAPNPALQRAFMSVLLSRAEGALGMVVDSTPNYRYPDHAQMWLALTRLEKQVQESLPDVAERTSRTKDKLFASLNADLQQRVDGDIVTENAPRKNFDQQVEWAEKTKNPAHRDQLLISAVTGSAKDQVVEKVLSVIDKISDPAVREPLTNWFYYFRAQDLISKKEFSEARNSAAKVPEMDQRAYLYTRIAEEFLKTDENSTSARELLDEVAQATRKAVPTIVSARAQLALAYLYAKFDTSRGIEELGNAVRTINALEAPDFSRQFVIMKLEGKSFASYFSFSTPGFNPENAFREMGKLDFDGSLAQATTFSDKSLRALTTLAVIEPCFGRRSTRIKTRI